MQALPRNRPPTQQALPLDFTPALALQMRTLFDTRWRRWHRAGSFEVAMQDPVTAKCLALAVLHLPQNCKARGK